MSYASLSPLAITVLGQKEAQSTKRGNRKRDATDVGHPPLLQYVKGERKHALEVKNREENESHAKTISTAEIPQVETRSSLEEARAHHRRVTELAHELDRLLDNRRPTLRQSYGNRRILEAHRQNTDCEDHYQATFRKYQRQWAQQQLENWSWYNQAQQQVIQQAQQANQVNTEFQATQQANQAITEFQAAQQANQANWNSQQVNQQYITQVPAGLPPISEEQHTQSPPTAHLGKGHLSGKQLWTKLKVYISKLFERHSNTTTKYLEDRSSSKK
ncbi:hypothetical protein AMATHDRAFT_8313 [Amanita thiersii Skay4041]|uniref:Uncharacterized protein n=1 Tax=Amanita thiersii Skay4041 TaxID=703135 RepID=A0A2A9N8D8_9AGAR|nr:hypothetical protein AMATHDRAFT_8313 [Amanita thiersii Skay4041]